MAKKNTDKNKTKQKNKIMGFDDVADTSSTDKDKYEPNFIEMEGPITIEIEDDVEELNKHFFATKQEEDDADKMIINILTKDKSKDKSQEEIESARTYMLYHLDQAFPNFAQEYFERRLKGEEITKETIRDILVDKTIDSIMDIPKQRELVEEYGGEQEWKKWFRAIFSQPAYEEKYKSMVENLILYSNEEIANHLNLNAPKNKPVEEQEEEFFVTNINKKNEEEAKGEEENTLQHKEDELERDQEELALEEAVRYMTDKERLAMDRILRREARLAELETRKTTMPILVDLPPLQNDPSDRIVNMWRKFA